ncbi:response regulator transcription factor [Marinomonas spartinae]|uniref:response regulator transcription factor n=1 Tax=Marinomonas spartinae TaxID=1792290 RepID=UPI0018F1DEA9|nr:helix-turn-helix transcriptional regulator [Marinomonas spartinae]MBJ7556855.1 helix-turn-helix transcriptional regulator [Marinomonas spartinae]
MSFLALFSQHSVRLSSYLGTEAFVPEMVSMFKALVDIDNITILAYPSKTMPRVEYNELPNGLIQTSIDKFLNGTFLLDPYYMAATKAQKQGFFALSELSPEGFKKSEYYHAYYKNSGLNDECGYLIWLGNDDAFINISLSRMNQQDVFDADTLKRLNDICPMVDWLVKQHWTKEIHSSPSFNLRQRLEIALDGFGTSLLTDRESQTVGMILHGYSNKAISERLHISVETVKLHRKNAYAKLDVTTAGELFNLFLDSVMSIHDDMEGDPLSYYMNARTIVQAP